MSVVVKSWQPIKDCKGCSDAKRILGEQMRASCQTHALATQKIRSQAKQIKVLEQRCSQFTMQKELSLEKSVRFIEEFRKLDAEMPLQAIAAFLTIAQDEGVTMREIGEKVGISQASCSRNVAALSEHHRPNKRGHDLVIAKKDPLEKRRKIIFLTPKGRLLAKAISAIW